MNDCRLFARLDSLWYSSIEDARAAIAAAAPEDTDRIIYRFGDGLDCGLFYVRAENIDRARLVAAVRMLSDSEPLTPIDPDTAAEVEGNYVVLRRLEDCNDPTRRKLFADVMQDRAGFPPAVQAAAAMVAAEDGLAAVA